MAIRQILVFECALVLLGCASAGTHVDQQTVAQFQRGKTTLSEVVAALGTPNVDIVRPDGTREIAYSYANVRTRPETFIPIVGLFAGGANSSVESYAFDFDSHSVLIGTARGDAQSRANMFEATTTNGTSAPAITSPPVTAPMAQSTSPAATPQTLQRQCTQAEETQKRIAIKNGYSMIPNCE